MKRSTLFPAKVPISETVLEGALFETYKFVRGASFAAIPSIPLVAGGIALAAGARFAWVVIWAICSAAASLVSAVVLTIGLRRMPWADPHHWLRIARQLLVLTGVVHAVQFAIVPVYRNGTLNPLWSATLMLYTGLLASNALLGFGIPGLFSCFAGATSFAAAASCFRVHGPLGPVLAFGCLVFYLVLLGTNRMTGKVFRASTELRIRNENLVAELEAANALLQVRAHTDALTGLANRAGLWSELERRGPTLGSSAVLFLDLDGFKPINDTFGHVAGDLVLRTVAERLSAVAREADIVARMGGDEFVVIANGMRDEDAHILAVRMTESIRTPIDVFGSLVTISASIGVAIHHGAESLHTTLGHADSLMYAAKRAHRTSS